MLGLGAMIHYMGGGSKEDPADFVGKTVTAVDFNSERLLLWLDNSFCIKVFDNGQSCCESRYMTTDDDPHSIVGGQIVHIKSKEGPNLPDSESHETCFVEVQTSKGLITLTNHNEHNGYYGGFGLSIEKVA